MRHLCTVAALLMFVMPATADISSISSIGIRSDGLGLDGSGILIGQVEIGRPGDPDKDLPDYYHEQTDPTQVYAGTSVDTANSIYVQGDNGLHATAVAGVMIASGSPMAGLRGVAPAAQLYAGAITATDDASIAVAFNRIAPLNGLYAMNVSMGRSLQPFIELANGNAHWTQYIDWSASTHDVLYVVGAGQEEDIVGVPQDNFNGITVASSAVIPGQGNEWRHEATFNAGFIYDAFGSRTSVDILAPGQDIFVTRQRNDEDFSQGSSLAAPHVTGAAALLHQYASQQITAGTPRWGNEAHFHEVTKAILLNSADKLDGIHGSNRDVLNKTGGDWTDTSAFFSETQSLDDNLGAGHLNVTSALQNFETGEYDPGTVPPIGWDYGDIGAFGNVEYTFNQTVSGYVAITLAWDRRVELTDPDNSYSFGDQFFTYSDVNDVLNNLDVYLLDSNGGHVTASRAVDDNLEHIFFEVEPGNYKIRVVHNGGLGDDQGYGLAWWAGEAPPTTQAGDFDGDGDVDGRDFIALQRDPSLGSLTAWQANYGDSVSGLANFAPVPEPGSAVLAMMAVFGMGKWPRVSRRRPTLSRAESMKDSNQAKKGGMASEPQFRKMAEVAMLETSQNMAMSPSIY